MRKIAYLSLLLILISCKHEGPHYNGYIDADLTYLSSDYAGRLATLDVHRGQLVKKNQFLFKLEQTTEQYSVDVNRLTHDNLLAQQQQIIDQLNYAEINYRRTSLMRKDKSASQNDVDVTKKDRDVLKDQLAAIQYQIKSNTVDIKNKEWQVNRKEGFATNPGVIFDTYYTKGEYVQAGQPVLSLITASKIKVIFFVPENDLSHIALNQKVLVSSDGTTRKLPAKISYISQNAQYTSPTIFSKEERAALVFRIEAQLDNPQLEQVHLGQPVTLELTS